jgi:hypothetical protein
VPAPIAVARLFRGGEFSWDLGENPASEEAGYNNAVAIGQEVLISHRMSTERLYVMFSFTGMKPLAIQRRRQNGSG